jgi:hypothetical protein
MTTSFQQKIGGITHGPYPDRGFHPDSTKVAFSRRNYLGTARLKDKFTT